MMQKRTDQRKKINTHVNRLIFLVEMQKTREERKKTTEVEQQSNEYNAQSPKQQ